MASDDSLPNDALDDEDQPAVPEKIEVHLHLHGAGEGNGARRKKVRRRLDLTGSLQDWENHYGQIFKRAPDQTPAKGAASLKICQACGYNSGVFARTCRKCGGPRPRSTIAKVMAAIGLASVLGTFAICAHFLGDSVREHKNPAPLRADDEYPYIIEYNASVPSPFGSTYVRTPELGP
jgi:ribosomal protein L40E